MKNYICCLAILIFTLFTAEECIFARNNSGISTDKNNKCVCDTLSYFMCKSPLLNAQITNYLSHVKGSHGNAWTLFIEKLGNEYIGNANNYILGLTQMQDYLNHSNNPRFFGYTFFNGDIVIIIKADDDELFFEKKESYPQYCLSEMCTNDNSSSSKHLQIVFKDSTIYLMTAIFLDRL